MVTGPDTPGVPSRLSTILSQAGSNLPNLQGKAPSTCIEAACTPFMSNQAARPATGRRCSTAAAPGVQRPCDDAPHAGADGSLQTQHVWFAALAGQQHVASMRCDTPMRQAAPF